MSPAHRTFRVIGAGLAATVALAGCAALSSGRPADVASNAAADAARSAAPATAPPYDMAALIHPAAGKYLGVAPSGPPDSMTAVKAFAASIGRRPDLIGAYVGWGEPFDASAVAHAWKYGALSYLAWEPSTVSVASIAAGHSDRYVKRFARAVRALNLPVAISFGHEMNGFWYPWGAGQVPPATFVAAWRHIHGVFAAAGATNVIWVWNPNVINPVPQVRLKPYYPGDAYVDWVGITGYFAITGPHNYATLYRPTIREVRRFTRKPFIIAETSVETGPDEITSARNLVASVTRHRDVLGLVWFDFDKAGVDWRIESRPMLRAALALRIARLPLVRVP